MTQDALQPTRTLIEFDLDAPREAIAKRAQDARSAVQNGDRTPGIALAGTTDALLNLEESQAWRETVAPITKSKNTTAAWRTTSLAGGDLIALRGADSSAAFDQLVALTDTASRRGVETLTIPVARIGNDSPLGYGDALNRTCALIASVIPHLERGGITLCLPAAHHGFLMSPPEMRELLDRLDSPWVAADVDMAEPRCDHATANDWFDTLGPRVAVVGMRATPSPDSSIKIPAETLRVIRTR